MIISVTKDGKDNLKVDKFDMAFDVIDKPLRRVVYSCGGFSLDGDCEADAAFCTHVFRNCAIRERSMISNKMKRLNTKYFLSL